MHQEEVVVLGFLVILWLCLLAVKALKSYSTGAQVLIAYLFALTLASWYAQTGEMNASFAKLMVGFALFLPTLTWNLWVPLAKKWLIELWPEQPPRLMK